MQRPGNWLTIVFAAILLGGFFLARVLLYGDPSTPAPATTPARPAGKTPLPPPDPASASPQNAPVRELEPKAAPRVDPTATEQGPPGRIVGRVVNPGHEPVANAEVELVQGPAVILQLRQLATETGIVTTTDANGQFKLEGVAPADDYVVFASHTEYGDSQAGPIVVHASDEASAGDIVLRQGVHVQGFVTADGRAVDGAIVTLSNQMDALRKLRPNVPNAPEAQDLKLTTRTDEKGHYEFVSVPVDSFEVTAESKGLARISKNTQGFLGASPREQEINFELTAALSIAGRVVDDSKNPITGAKVTASIAATGIRCEQSATSGGNGLFTLESLAQGQYFVSTECDGYSPANRAQIEAGTADVEIVLQIQGAVTGVVVDEESGSPVVDFELTVMQSFKGRGPAPGRIHRKIHDAGGRFELKNINPGVFQLLGQSDGYADSLSDEFTVTRGQVTPSVRVLMNRGGSVTGSVIDRSGKAVPNALVILRSNKMKDNPISAIFRGVAAGDPEQKVRSDAQGSFRVDLVVPGTYQVAIRQPQFALFEQNDVEVRKNEVNNVGRLELRAGAKLHGHVYDWEGKAIGGGVLNAVSAAGDYLTVRCDNEGAYVIQSMPPGDYTVTIGQFASSPPINPLESIIIAKNSAKKVSLADGDDTQVDLTLTRTGAPKKSENK